MKRSKFSLSNYKLLSGDMGELIPIGLTEVLPGDSIQQSTSALVRLAPLMAPVMHPVRVRIHHWFVPHRLVWPDFEKFITGGDDGNDDTAFPVIKAPSDTGFPVGTLADYLGVPPAVPDLEVSALPFRGYALIYNEFYRDQDLQGALPISTDSGLDTTTATTLQNVAWERDYFTTSRPWEQKGPQISIPITGDAPVVGIGFNGSVGPGTNGTWRDSDGSDTAENRVLTTGGITGIRRTESGATGRPEIFADLSGVSAVTVNILREAMALQRFEEARARFGSRYTEYLRYLGIRSSDARLQRPEYLGGGKQTIQFSEVLQTAEGENPVGEMKGHGIGAMRTNRYRRFFEEHGYIYSFISVQPKTIYAQGLPRTWNRRVKEDFFQKELQHIGQQEVLNKEVYASHSDAEGTFGYQDRYDEYRRAESSVAGEFRTSELDFWHFARFFENDPALNGDFVRCVPAERPFAVPSYDVLYIMASHSIQARRIVAKTGKSFIF